MSDLYLVLRNRLDAVPEWVYIEPEILRAARERRGFSYETMAREVHVSSKTWERYEKAGRVPRPLLATVAEVLELEIEEPARQRVVAAGSKEERSEILDRLDKIEELLAHLDENVSRLVPAEAADAPSAVRAAAVEADRARGQVARVGRSAQTRGRRGTG